MIKKKFYILAYPLGAILLVLSILLIIPFLISLFLGEGYSIYRAFLIPLVISFITGFSLIKFRKKEINIDLGNGMILCTFAWVIVSVVGAIPFQIGLNASFIDSFFEAVSGFTTTGITVFDQLTEMPFSILFWRSFIQWLGGLGILTFFLLITFRNEGELWQLFSAESHKISNSRPVPNIFRSIEILWAIYFVFTISQIFILLILGVEFSNTLIHSLTTISTGGFSNYDSSIAYFQQSGHPNYKLIEYTIIFFMMMGGINFLVHYRVSQGDLKELFINSEIKYFWKILAGVLLIILAAYYFEAGKFNFDNFEDIFRKTLFQVTAIMTTTGYETQHIGSAFFPVAARQLFLLLMLIGGSVGSTSGGVKVLRVSILYKLFKRDIKKINYSGKILMPVVIDQKIISSEEILKIAGIFFAWIALILIGGIITAIFSDLTAEQSISGMFSAVGNIGPFYFSVAEMQNLSPIIKVTYIIGMLAGRLEMLPVFYIFTKDAWK